MIWERQRDCAAWETGGRMGGRGDCVLAGSNLPWEESRSKGAGREKLGHVEKSSCNDPNQRPANSLDVWPHFSCGVFFCLLHTVVTRFCSLWYSVKLFSSSILHSIFSSHPLLTLLLFITTFLSFHLISYSTRVHLSNNQLGKRRTDFHTSSNLAISRSNFTSNGVALVQRDISQTEAERQQT